MSNLSGPVIFGEVLYDIFPDGTRVLGGAPFNVAWHCQAFGLNPLFISSVGNDSLGNEIKTAMQEWGMNTQGLQTDSSHDTGVVNVNFKDGEPSYNIVENSAWDFIEEDNLPELGSGSLLYHGSLSMRNSITGKSLALLKQKYPDSIFVDINLRPPWWNLQQVKDIIHSAQWIKLNIDELNLIVPDVKGMIEKARHLMSQCDYQFIVVTQGAKGAIAIDRSVTYSVEPENSINVVDTVGAGDAFTSVLLLGLHKGWPLQQIINRAQEFASKIVGLHGATIQDIDFYKPFITRWSL